MYFGPDDKPIMNKNGKLWQPDQRDMMEIRDQNPQEYADIMELERGADAENKRELTGASDEH